jgi:hypothetical protein
MTKFILAGLIAILLAATAHADTPIGLAQRLRFMTGEQLTKYCQTDLLTEKNGGRARATQAVDATYCVAYVLGVLDMIAFENRATATPYFICIPDGINNLSIAETVGNYLDQNPAKRNLAGVEIAILALTDAFWCESNTAAPPALPEDVDPSWEKAGFFEACPEEVVYVEVEACDGRPRAYEVRPA